MAATTYLFQPAAIVCTPRALRALTLSEIRLLDLIDRHRRGDFGVLDEEDQVRNRSAIENGGRLLSSYPLPTQGVVWLITEADRSVTTLLLPDEC